MTAPETADDSAGIDFASIGELAALLDAREISAIELAARSMERLEQLGMALNAVAALMPERALAEARAADRRRSAGAAGPLLGIPYGAKDILAARGAPTTYGSGAFADQWLDADATSIGLLKRAGAPLVAKLAMAELTGTGTRDPRASLHGPARNPWDPDRYPGGSSTGSGAAVAGGMVPFALGSETGGSIAAPAALCGITGIRPTYGLVSRFGAMPVSWSLDKIGVLSRSAADCGRVLGTIGRADDRDPGSARRKFTWPDPITRADRPVKAGIWWPDIDEAADVGLRSALREGLAALRESGIDFVDAAPPEDLPYWETLTQIMDGDAASAMGSVIDDHLDKLTTEAQREGMHKLLEISAREYIDAQRVRVKIQAAASDLFMRIDLLVSYTLPIDASVIPVDRPVLSVERRGGNTALIALGNLAGLPGVFVPCGLSDQGMPVGLQLVGPPFSDGRLLQLAERFQDATSWHRLRPPMQWARPSEAAG